MSPSVGKRRRRRRGRGRRDQPGQSPVLETEVGPVNRQRRSLRRRKWRRDPQCEKYLRQGQALVLVSWEVVGKPRVGRWVWTKMVSDKQIRRLRERARKVGGKTRCLVATKGNGSFTKRKRTDSVTQARAYPCPWDVGKHEVVVSAVGAVLHWCGWKPGGVGRGQMQGGSRGRCRLLFQTFGQF